MKTTTFSVLLLAKKAKANNGIAPIYARLTLNGKRSDISLKTSVELSQWCSVKCLIKGTKTEVKKVNTYLTQCKTELYNSYKEILHAKAHLSLESIKNHYLGIEEDEQTLLQAIEYHNSTMQQTLAWGTQKNYLTTARYIAEFLINHKKVKDIYLKQLKYNFIVEFEHYLKNRKPIDHQKPCGHNGALKHIERLRKIIALALKNEWLAKDPFLQYTKKFEKVDRGYLNEEQLFTLENKLITIERLATIRDLFVFSCYTGLAYIDVMQLKESNLNLGIDGEQWLSFQRQKTKTQVNIPLLPKALALVKQYASHPQVVAKGSLFPNYSNQKLNAYLKELAHICGIQKNLTFHLARHTFATTVTLCNGVPIETVSKMLGHTKIATTQVYARVVNNKISKDMLSLKQRLNKENGNNPHQRMAL